MHLQESTTHACKVLFCYAIVGQCTSIYNAKLTGSEVVPSERFPASVGRSLMFHSFGSFFFFFGYFCLAWGGGFVMPKYANCIPLYTSAVIPCETPDYLSGTLQPSFEISNNSCIFKMQSQPNPVDFTNTQVLFAKE